MCRVVSFPLGVTLHAVPEPPPQSKPERTAPADWVVPYRLPSLPCTRDVRPALPLFQPPWGFAVPSNFTSVVTVCPGETIASAANNVIAVMHANVLDFTFASYVKLRADV